MGGEQPIGAHAQNLGTLRFNCNNTIQDKKKARRTLTGNFKGA